jgi:hypothetical protein
VTETLFTLWPVVSLVAGVLLVWLAGSITGGIKFESWGAAFGAVLVVISGMHIKGVFGLLLAALALTAIQLAFIYLPFALAVMNS